MTNDNPRYRAMGKKQVEMEEFTDRTLSNIFIVYERKEKIFTKSLSYWNRIKLVNYFTSLIKEGLFDNEELCDDMFNTITSGSYRDRENFDILIGHLMVGTMNRTKSIEFRDTRRFNKQMIKFTDSLFIHINKILTSCIEKRLEPMRDKVLETIASNVVDFIKDRDELHNNKYVLKDFIVAAHNKIFNDNGSPDLKVPKRDIDDALKRIESKLKDLK